MSSKFSFRRPPVPIPGAAGLSLVLTAAASALRTAGLLVVAGLHLNFLLALKIIHLLRDTFQDAM